MASDAVPLHRRALRLEWFTVSWNVVETGVAISAGVMAGSTALVGFGVDSAIEASSAVAVLWRLRRAGPSADVEKRSQAGRRALFFVSGTVCRTRRGCARIFRWPSSRGSDFTYGSTGGGRIRSARC